MDPIRWGILGTGGIAQKFAEALALLPDARMVGVGSRSPETADAFGRRHGIPKRYGSYAELCADPEVDVVYVATPHPLHRANTLECLWNGKAVLCEKPFALNAREGAEMVAAARNAGRFLMEAMWTRYFPVMIRVRQLLAEGALGDLRQVLADFGFYREFDPRSRLYDPALGGGTLLDIGIYPVSLISHIFGGPPQRILSAAVMGRTGVDEQSAAILSYEGGRQGVFACSFRGESAKEVHIIGSGGRVRIHKPWWLPAAFSISRGDGDEEIVRLPYTGNGYVHEAVEVMECLRAGRLESALMPLDETLSILRTLDSIREQWGLRYPSER